MLLNAWKASEEKHGNAADVKKVQDMMPIVTRKQRKVNDSEDVEEQCTYFSFC